MSSPQIATDEQNLKAATEIRDKEAADVAAEEADLSETIVTTRCAVTILERQLNKGASLMQLRSIGSGEQALAVMVKASAFSTADAYRLAALVLSLAHTDESDMDVDAPDADKYEDHSGDIIATLQVLLDDAQGRFDEMGTSLGKSFTRRCTRAVGRDGHMKQIKNNASVVNI